MTVETSPLYISDLNASYPAAADSIPEGDDHLRNIKTVLKTTLPNVSGAITPTHTELNYVDGVTSAIQTQLDTKAPIASPTFTGTAVLPATTSIGTVSATELAYVDGVTSAIQTQLDAKAPLASPALTGTPTAPTAAVDTNTTQVASTAYVVGQAYAKLVSPALTGTPTAPTAAPGTATTQISTTAFVDAKAFATALPSQTGNSGKFVTTDGSAASWSLVPLASGVSGTLPVANGGTGAASLTANNVLLGNGTSAPQAVAPGTSGNVLMSNGTTWASTAPATGGGITTIASGSLPAAATLDITNIPATYAYLVLQILGASSNTATRGLQLQGSTDNGSTFDTNASNYSLTNILNATVTAPGTATMLYMAPTAAAADLNNAVVVITSYQAGPYKTFRGTQGESMVEHEFFGTWNATSSMNALRLLWNDTGNFDAGTYVLYGVS